MYKPQYISPKNSFIIFGCVFFVFLTVTFTMPDSYIQRAVLRHSQTLILNLGLEQVWKPFISDYTTVLTWRFAQEYADGSVTRNPFYSISPPSHQRTAMRELMIHISDTQAYFNTFADYLCKEDSPHGKPVKVTREVAAVVMPTITRAAVVPDPLSQPLNYQPANSWPCTP